MLISCFLLLLLLDLIKSGAEGVLERGAAVALRAVPAQVPPAGVRGAVPGRAPPQVAAPIQRLLQLLQWHHDRLISLSFHDHLIN